MINSEYSDNYTAEKKYVEKIDEKYNLIQKCRVFFRVRRQVGRLH